MCRELIFVGVVKNVPNCGVSVKNKIFIDRFSEIFNRVWVVGVKKSRINLFFLPFQLLRLIALSLLHKKAVIVLSSNSWESSIIIKCLQMVRQECRVCYWVAGGIFHELLGDSFQVKTYRNLRAIYVQSPKMVQVMKQKGLNNVLYVPNSKRIDYFPPIREWAQGSVVKFLFLSRVHPDKGCGLILESVRRINERGFGDRFIVDFYGEIFADYRDLFFHLLSSLNNVRYNGFLDLTHSSGYDILSQYDVLLFPTYWYGEGFPGIVIDAYVSGVPIIASDWNFNTDVVTDKTGIIIPHHNQKRLEDEMLRFINGEYDINKLKRNCQNLVKEYDNRQVLSEQNLKKLGMLS